MGKKIGYLLLLCGLGVIIAGSVMLWRILYGSMQPPQTFNSETAVTLTLATGMVINVPLPPQINKFANLSLAFMFMFFLVVVGGRIAGVGATLINAPQPKEPAPKL